MLENIKKTVTNYAKNAWNKKVNKDKLLENRISSDMVFEGVNLANLDLSDKTLKNVKFINCDLSGVDFTRSTFKNVTFENCNCNNSIFREANVFDSDFQASYFDNANFKESTINNTNIELSDFRSASFQNTSFSSANGKPIDNSNFNDADFTNAYFCDYKVSNSKFRGANLPDNIHKCEFIKSDLRDTNIQNIELDAVKFEVMQSEPSPEELEDDSYNNYAYETRSDSKNPVNSYSFNAKKEIETSLNEKDFEKAYKTVLKLGGTIKSFLSKVIEHFGANQNALHDAVQSVTNVENKSTEYAAKLLNDILKTPEYRKAFEKTQSEAKEYTK